MHFIKAAALLSLFAATSAAPSVPLEKRAATGTPFWPTFRISGYDWPVDTVYGYFYIGKDGSTVGCAPEKEGTKGCDTIGSTHWLIWYAGTAILEVKVEGGQQIYIDSTGALRYTPPGNPKLPAGVTDKGFKINYGSGADSKKLFFSHTKGSFVACPEGPEGVYKLYVDGKDKKLENEKKCIPVTGSGNPSDKDGFQWYSYLTEPKKA